MALRCNLHICGHSSFIPRCQLSCRWPFFIALFPWDLLSRALYKYVLSYDKLIDKVVTKAAEINHNKIQRCFRVEPVIVYLRHYLPLQKKKNLLFVLFNLCFCSWTCIKHVIFHQCFFCSFVFSTSMNSMYLRI